MKTDTFTPFVLDQLSDLAGLSSKAMFGGRAFYLRGTIFGIVLKGRLYLKTDDGSRPGFIEAGMRPFCPRPGRKMPTYYEVPPGVLEDRSQLEAWSRRAATGSPPPRVEIHPATPERWDDLARLFGPKGACAGCWCMYWRVPRSQYQRNSGAGNRRALRALVTAGSEPGLIAYVNGAPAGWCSLAPREEYTSLSRSRILAPVDEAPVWSIPCFFVLKPYRRTGLTVRLLEEAARHARRRGARILEGYPVEPARGTMPDVFAWTGLPGAFRKAGFKEVLRRSATRPIYRRVLRAGR